MKKVMFVCLGNICRSPVAEAVFNFRAKERGLDEKYLADSSGTSSYHVGADPDPRMQLTAEKHGVPMHHSAQQFQRDHFEEMDIIFAMDAKNYEDILSLTQNEQHRTKVHLIREFDPLAIGDRRDTPDPYYGRGYELFEEVFDIVWRSSEEILDLLESGNL